MTYNVDGWWHIMTGRFDGYFFVLVEIDAAIHCDKEF